MTKEATQLIDKLKKRVEHLESSVLSIKTTIDLLEKEFDSKDYAEVDGIVGTFDGYHMVTKDGEKHEVPANYAAKSKLVYGDNLKLIEEKGKKLFKHISKVDRASVEGILTKKEGEWYALTDRGSYRVSDTAAEYQRAELNSEATILLPKDNLDAPFATLDVVQGYGPEKPVKTEKQGSANKKKRSSKKRATTDTDSNRNTNKDSNTKEKELNISSTNTTIDLDEGDLV